MTAPVSARPQAVELVPEYPGMIRLITFEGDRLHYLPDSRGVLVLGQPFIGHGDGHSVHLFVPLEPGRFPTILKVDKL